MTVWETLKNQASKFVIWGKTLECAGEIEGAFYLLHMSVELIMKSAIAHKNLGWHPTNSDSHNLTSLVSDSRTQFILVDMVNDVNTDIHKRFTLMNFQNRAWKMQYRYSGAKLDKEQMTESIEIYGEILKWMKKKYPL